MSDKKNTWVEWYTKVPNVKFKPEWDVRAVPPFCGAAVRYRVMHNGKDISIYLDIDDSLGCVGEPYWEIYPSHNGDTERFLLNETAELVAAIERSLQ